jgi:hypothetical protein
MQAFLPLEGSLVAASRSTDGTSGYSFDLSLGNPAVEPAGSGGRLDRVVVWHV